MWTAFVLRRVTSRLPFVANLSSTISPQTPAVLFTSTSGSRGRDGIGLVHNGSMTPSVDQS